MLTFREQSADVTSVASRKPSPSSSNSENMRSSGSWPELLFCRRAQTCKAQAKPVLASQPSTRNTCKCKGSNRSLHILTDPANSCKPGTHIVSDCEFLYACRKVSSTKFMSSSSSIMPEESYRSLSAHGQSIFHRGERCPPMLSLPFWLCTRGLRHCQK